MKNIKLFEEFSNENKLTLSEFEKIPAGEVFASGITTDDENGANMTRSGKKLKWIAKKGHGDDWAIYVHWATSSDDYVKRSGDKVSSKENIMRLVPCEEEVFKKYRL